VNLFEQGEAFIRHYFDQVYDPVKAHQYYEEHKDLKGRSPAASSSSSSKSKSPPIASSSQSKAAQAAEAAKRKAKLDADVAALKARLEQLRVLLRELVAEAKRRSGVEVDSEGKTSTDTKKSDDKELTPAEKDAKAKEAHDYYEKTKGTLPSQETTHVLKQKIALIEKKIAEIRATLASLPAEKTESPSPSGPENTTKK